MTETEMAKEAFRRKRAEIEAKSINEYERLDMGFQVKQSDLEPQEEEKAYTRILMGDLVGQFDMEKDIFYYLNPERRRLSWSPKS